MTNLTAKIESGSQPIKRRLVVNRRKSYQQGSVKLHRDNWTLRYRELDHTTGKWITRRDILDNCKNRKDALKASEPIMAQVNMRNNLKPNEINTKITFKGFVESYWQAHTVKQKLQISSIHQRNSLLDLHLLPYFGSKLMQDVQPSDISKFFQLKAKSEKEYSDSSLSSFYGLLRVIFDLAEQNDVINKSPVRSKLHKPELARVEKPTLTAAQIREVLSHLSDEQERLVALLLAVTGMRVGEGVALRWVDFNAQACELSINHTLYRGKLKDPKTESSKAKIRLAPQIAALLLTHKEGSSFQAEEDFIFCQEDGSPLKVQEIRRHLYKAMDQVGIKRVKGKYGLHIFRHSAGTLLYAKSRDLKLVQGTLRHGDISTTSDIYVHLSDEVLNEGSEILAAEILGTGDLSVTQESKMVS